ncbi:MAG: ribosome silencing factor [Gemmatimonadota bacterium]
MTGETEASVGRRRAGERPPELVRVTEAAMERNARQAVVLDLRGLSDATDFFLIASGDSDVHTRAIADNVLERMKEAGYRPIGIEGRSAGRWILIDFVNLIVHIFLPGVREFYQLERLWGDAPRAELA